MKRVEQEPHVICERGRCVSGVVLLARPCCPAWSFTCCSYWAKARCFFYERDALLGEAVQGRVVASEGLGWWMVQPSNSIFIKRVCPT